MKSKALRLDKLRRCSRSSATRPLASSLLAAAGPALMLWCLATTGVAVAGEPRVVITRRPVTNGAAGCRAYGWIHNEDPDRHVAVVFRKTQHLFSGKQEQTLGLLLRPGERRSLGCVSWPGAMRPTDYAVLDVWVYEPPRRPADAPE